MQEGLLRYKFRKPDTQPLIEDQRAKAWSNIGASMVDAGIKAQARKQEEEWRMARENRDAARQDTRFNQEMAFKQSEADKTAEYRKQEQADRAANAARDDEYRKQQLENQSAESASTALYRQKQLANADAESARTAEYRKQQLQNERDRNNKRKLIKVEQDENGVVRKYYDDGTAEDDVRTVEKPFDAEYFDEADKSNNLNSGKGLLNISEEPVIGKPDKSTYVDASLPNNLENRLNTLKAKINTIQGKEDYSLTDYDRNRLTMYEAEENYINEYGEIPTQGQLKSYMGRSNNSATGTNAPEGYKIIGKTKDGKTVYSRIGSKKGDPGYMIVGK